MSRLLLRGRANRAMQAGIALSFLLLVFASAALAQDRRQNTPGQFDIYLLALSWSPSYCEGARERAREGARSAMRRAALCLCGARAVAAI